VEELRGQAQRGLPASVRALAWAALLGVDVKGAAAPAESGAAGQCDEGELRQMGRDLPRCHAYDPVLASPAGRARLGRVLAAWAGRNPDLAYWQAHTRARTPAPAPARPRRRLACALACVL
jgi:TBC domain-containing protein kinase-like protein